MKNGIIVSLCKRLGSAVTQTRYFQQKRCIGFFFLWTSTHASKHVLCCFVLFFFNPKNAIVEMHLKYFFPLSIHALNIRDHNDITHNTPKSSTVSFNLLL